MAAAAMLGHWLGLVGLDGCCCMVGGGRKDGTTKRAAEGGPVDKGGTIPGAGGAPCAGSPRSVTMGGSELAGSLSGCTPSTLPILSEDTDEAADWLGGDPDVRGSPLCPPCPRLGGSTSCSTCCSSCTLLAGAVVFLDFSPLYSVSSMLRADESSNCSSALVSVSSESKS